MHALPLPSIAPPRIIVLDGWAWKRGQRYGALVVDLERKRPTRMEEGKVGEWSVREAQFEKIPLSIPPAFCDGRVKGKLPFEKAM